MFALYLASSLYMTGLIWFVQVVHYPLFDAVKDASGEYYRLHAAKTSLVVILPMLVQAACAVWFAIKPGEWTPLLMRIMLVMIVLVWISTFTLSVPQHNQLAGGYSAQAVQKLVSTNWIRTILWSVHAGLLVWMLISETRGNG